MKLLSKDRVSALPWRAALLYSLLVLLVSFSFSTALVEIASVAALLFFAGAMITERCNPFRELPKLAFAALAAYVAITLLSLLWSEYPKESFRGIFKVLQQVSIFFLVAQLPRNITADPLFKKVFLTLLAAVIANGLFQYALGVDFIRGYHSVAASAGDRVTSSFKSYGLFANFLVLFLPLLIAYTVTAPRFSRFQILLAILVFEGFLCLYLTRSRGAWLGLFAGAFLTFFIFRQWRLTALLLLLAAAGLLLMPRNVLIHLDIQRKEQSIIERFDLWQRAVDVIEVKPLTGTGINTYTKAHLKYDTSGSWRVRDYYAHNGYLQMAAEIGLPGTAAFLCFLGSFFLGAFRRSFQVPAEDRLRRIGMLVGLLSFCLFAAWDTLLHNPQAVTAFWFLAGLMASAMKEPPDKIAS